MLYWILFLPAGKEKKHSSVYSRSHTYSFQALYEIHQSFHAVKAVFLYCYPDCPAHFNSVGWATWIFGR